MKILLPDAFRPLIVILLPKHCIAMILGMPSLILYFVSFIIFGQLKI